MSCSGTTAVVALLRPKEKTLYVAWVGDSQALLVNQGRVLQIVNPHKPSRQVSSKGCVHFELELAKQCISFIHNAKILFKLYSFNQLID